MKGIIRFLGVLSVTQNLKPKTRYCLLRRFGTIAILLFCAMVLFAASPSISSAAWRIEAVDAPRNFEEMSQRSIAIDKDNRPHIAYGGDNLYYAYYDGTKGSMRQ